MRPPAPVCVLVIASILSGQVEGEAQATLVLRNVSIIDGNGGAATARRSLVIRAGRIATISDVPNPMPESGVQSLDLSGHYVIPGLVDSHVHLGIHAGDPTAGLRAAFAGGVTSVRDMGGDEVLVRALAERNRDPEVPEPRIYFATAIRGRVPPDDPRQRPHLGVKRPAVPPWLQDVVADEATLRGAVIRAKASGATGIKLYSNLPLPLMKAVAVLARQEGLGVWSHARVFPHRPSDAVSAGIAVLSHSSQLAFEQPDAPDNGDAYRVVNPEAPTITTLLQEMRARGVILEPTVYASANAARAAGISAARLATAPTFSWAARVTRLAHERGVTLLAGTDRLNERGGSGDPSIHEELAFLVSQAGLSPLEAISAATRTAARVLGNDDVHGTIAVGKWADLVILGADPSLDIRNTRRVALVVKAGVVYRFAQSSSGGRSGSTGRR